LGWSENTPTPAAAEAYAASEPGAGLRAALALRQVAPEAPPPATGDRGRNNGLL
jgi:hypothetical protein